MNVYAFNVKDVEKNEVNLSAYEGKVLLIVNTATGCGFTPQYEGLEALYKKYKDKGLEILDFPCNQFLNQAPGSDAELANFCQVKYGTTFKTFAKIEVNGQKADPLYTFLKDSAPDENEDNEASGFKEKLKKLSQTFVGNNIKWNFTKFLVGKDGTVVGRFAPTFKPEDLESYIEKALNS